MSIIARSVGAAMQGKWSTIVGPWQLALLTGVPPVTSGAWDITGLEPTGGGYARAAFAYADLAAATDADPTVRTNTADIVWPANTDATPWESVGWVAVLNTTGTTVVTVLAMNETVAVGPHAALAIPAGSLRLAL